MRVQPLEFYNDLVLIIFLTAKEYSLISGIVKIVKFWSTWSQFTNVG